ncbi:MAG TPA: hypothetical protein PL110_14790 [Candidatus Eremiobacteraeota bacterium]|nr:MAG: hypothetical protein BWY64_03683 [bacterium ADurb.Bin363]HPZ09374.1 hypothetical protein [Candidatus Eremiobacteraeota bacterium]
MKIDRIGPKVTQQPVQIKSVKQEAEESTETKVSLPPCPVKPAEETSPISQIGSVARSIAGEDLIKEKAQLDKPIVEAMEIVLEQKGE